RQHPPDLHLHAGEVRDHSRGERTRDAAATSVADADRARLRPAGPGPKGPRRRPSPPRLDTHPATVAGAGDCRLDDGDPAVAVAEGRERRMGLALDRGVDLGEEVAEGLAVALAVAGGVAGE